MGNQIDDPVIDWIAGMPMVEDVEVFPGDRWAIGSSMQSPVDGSPGALYVLDLSNMTATQAWPGGGSVAVDPRFEISQPVSPSDLFLHGICVAWTSDSNGTLYAVHHGVRETIEVFEIDAVSEPPSVTWVGAIPRGDGTYGNAVACTSDGLIAGQHQPGMEASAEFQSGDDAGNLQRWTTADGWVAVPGSECCYPNGVAVSEDEAWYFVADWRRNQIIRLDAKGGAAPSVVDLNFAPDNLKWDRDGRLLVAGLRLDAREFFPAVMANPAHPAPIVVASIDPEDLSVTTILDADIPFGILATATRMGSGDLLMTSISGGSVGRLRQS